MRKNVFALSLFTLLPVFPTLAAAQFATWTPTGSMAVARVGHTATLLPDGDVLIVGGSSTTTTELYHPATGTFTPTGSTLVPHGQGSTATRLTDGRVLIVGGHGAPTFAEIYHPASQTFTSAGRLNRPETGHTATLLLDGRVLIAGGGGPRFCFDFPGDASAELYDPATNTFSLTGSLSTVRCIPTATLLPDGRVLIAGGQLTTSPGFSVCLKSAELYDPSTGTFSVTGTMSVERCAPEVSVLDDGEVLILGGFQRSAELFHPTSWTFSPTGSMTTTHANAAATLLLNGQVLVAGGRSFGSTGEVTLGSAELYDPVRGTFTATASMITARQEHTATLLLNGQVLVTGGLAITTLSTGTGRDCSPNACGQVFSSAELLSSLVPFAALSARVEIEHDDAFEVKATFTLGAGSNGIAPLTEDVKLRVGTFSITIPAGSFTQDGGGQFKFEGVIANVTLEVEIKDLGGGNVEFKAEGDVANLTGTVNPVTMALTIGDDVGTATITAEFNDLLHGRHRFRDMHRDERRGRRRLRFGPRLVRQLAAPIPVGPAGNVMASGETRL